MKEKKYLRFRNLKIVYIHNNYYKLYKVTILLNIFNKKVFT